MSLSFVAPQNEERRLLSFEGPGVSIAIFNSKNYNLQFQISTLIFRKYNLHLKKIELENKTIFVKKKCFQKSVSDLKSLQVLCTKEVKFSLILKKISKYLKFFFQF